MEEETPSPSKKHHGQSQKRYGITHPPLTLISIHNIKRESQPQHECHHEQTVANHFFLDSAQGTMGCGDTLKRCYI